MLFRNELVMLLFKLIMLFFPLMTQKPIAELLSLNVLLCKQSLEGIF